MKKLGKVLSVAAVAAMMAASSASPAFAGGPAYGGPGPIYGGYGAPRAAVVYRPAFVGHGHHCGHRCGHGRNVVVYRGGRANFAEAALVTVGTMGAIALLASVIR